jgi:hypothetical protein
MKLQKSLRVSARLGLVLARPILTRDYQFVRKQMDEEAAEERKARKPSK